jgi:hypothetical protein
MQKQIPASFGKLIAAIIIMMPALLLTSCMNPQGTHMTKDQAFAYFNKNRAELESIVNDIKFCNPIIPEGIFYTVNKSNLNEFKCKNDKSKIKLSLIKRIENINLNAIGLIGNYYNNNQLSTIVFSYYRVGLSVSGVTEDFRYSITEIKNLDENSYFTEPLTNKPWHWFWVVIED